MAGEPFIPDQSAGGGLASLFGNAVSSCNFGWRQYDEKRHTFRHCRDDLRQQVGVRYDRLSAVVVQHIRDFGRLAMPVDRHAVGAEPLRSIARLEERNIIAQYHGNCVAATDAKCGKPTCRPRRSVEEHLARDLPIPADDPPLRNVYHASLPSRGHSYCRYCRLRSFIEHTTLHDVSKVLALAVEQ